MAEHCTCGDFAGEDPFCREHGDRLGHWPVSNWGGGAHPEIELADCPKCGGWGEYDARCDMVTCQGEDCDFASRGPTSADKPEALQ